MNGQQYFDAHGVPISPEENFRRRQVQALSEVKQGLGWQDTIHLYSRHLMKVPLTVFYNQAAVSVPPGPPLLCSKIVIPQGDLRFFDQAIGGTGQGFQTLLSRAMSIADTNLREPHKLGASEGMIVTSVGLKFHTPHPSPCALPFLNIEQIGLAKAVDTNGAWFAFSINLALELVRGIAENSALAYEQNQRAVWLGQGQMFPAGYGITFDLDNAHAGRDGRWFMQSPIQITPQKDFSFILSIPNPIEVALPAVVGTISPPFAEGEAVPYEEDLVVSVVCDLFGRRDQQLQ